MKKICVVGSFNIDIIATVNAFPRTSETVRCNSFDLFVGGGKGANQAVALGRLGADVMMVGRLGDRFYGPEYINVLKRNNVNCDTVDVIENSYPGSAFVAVNAEGDNILFIHAGTNAMLDIGYIDANWDKISERDVFLFQLEIPLETNLYAIEKLKKLGKTIILDPAPAMNLPIEIYRFIDFITPNEVELAQISGQRITGSDDLLPAARILLDRGVGTVVAKVGKNGSYVFDRHGARFAPPTIVKAIDPTAAGDTFNAAFAFALASGKDAEQCAHFANVVAAISTLAIGAQNAMPTMQQVEEFMQRPKQSRKTQSSRQPALSALGSHENE
ncbi:MAG: ribokinase [Candidatus Pacebacteria bacterium]|nr:ribokinase [Candidatus Paceibacterota bacterium]